MKIGEMADVFTNSAYFAQHSFFNLGTPSSYTLNLKALKKVSKVSWTSQLFLKENSEKTNFISPKKLLPSHPGLRGLRIHINLCSIFLNFPYWITIISWNFLAIHNSFVMPDSFPFFGTLHCWHGFWDPFWFYMWLIFHGFGAIKVQLKCTIHRCYIHANLERNLKKVMSQRSAGSCTHCTRANAFPECGMVYEYFEWCWMVFGNSEWFWEMFSVVSV